MRLIGHIDSRATATTFSQYLRIQGIANQLEREHEGWAVWVYSEEERSRAKDLLLGFLGNPDDPKFNVAALTKPAEAPVLAAEAAESSGPSRVLRSIESVTAVKRLGIGPFTLALIGACVGVGLLTGFGDNLENLMPLFITSFEMKGSMLSYHPGLPEVVSWELWRLITPIFIHFGVIHLLLNIMWLMHLGSMIECFERTSRLAWLVLVIAPVSNLGEYFLSGPSYGGMSGIVYGLLGYIWMQCRIRPESGYFLNRSTVVFMLVWFFVCLVGIVPNVANGAHAFGLLLGIFFGFTSAKWSAGRRRSDLLL